MILPTGPNSTEGDRVELGQLTGQLRQLTWSYEEDNAAIPPLHVLATRQKPPRPVKTYNQARLRDDGPFANHYCLEAAIEGRSVLVAAGDIPSRATLLAFDTFEDLTSAVRVLELEVELEPTRRMVRRFRERAERLEAACHALMRARRTPGVVASAEDTRRS
jgi:hypothetical protein